jgi:hypothetical protein
VQLNRSVAQGLIIGAALLVLVLVCASMMRSLVLQAQASSTEQACDIEEITPEASNPLFVDINAGRSPLAKISLSGSTITVDGVQRDLISYGPKGTAWFSSSQLTGPLTARSGQSVIAEYSMLEGNGALQFVHGLVTFNRTENAVTVSLALQPAGGSRLNWGEYGLFLEGYNLVLPDGAVLIPDGRSRIVRSVSSAWIAAQKGDCVAMVSASGLNQVTATLAAAGIRLQDRATLDGTLPPLTIQFLPHSSIQVSGGQVFLRTPAYFGEAAKYLAPHGERQPN